MQSPHQILDPSRPSRRSLLLGAGATALTAAAATAASTTTAAATTTSTGAATSAAGAPSAAAAGVGAAGIGAAPAVVPSPDTLPLTGGPDFPIGLFWPPHPYASTAQRFAEIKNAG